MKEMQRGLIQIPLTNPGILPNVISRVCIGLNCSRYIYLSWGCVEDLLVVHYGRVGMHTRWVDAKVVTAQISRLGSTEKRYTEDRIP